MSISLFLKDAFSKVSAHVTNDNEQLVIASSYPALQPQKYEIFRQYLTDDGLSTGSNDMGIDGSTTNVDFYIEADSKNDRYITNVNLILGYGASAQPFQFADSTALTNGVRVFYDTAERGEIDIHEGAKSNQDIFRLSHSAVGTAWEVRGVNATNDYGYFITIDFESFMPPYGIKLDRGSRQRLTFTIRDNCTNADAFNAIAYGFDRFE